VTSEVLPTVVSVALAVAGLTLAAGGAMVATRTAATVAGGLFGAAGVVAVVSVVSAASDDAGRSPSLGLALAGTLLGLAVMAFPIVHRDLPGVVAVVAVIALPVAQWIYAGFAGDAVELALLLAGVPLLHVWWRLETADPDERRALSWILAAVVPLMFAGLVVGMLEAPPVVVALYLLCFGSVSWAAWIGASRPSAVDVRGLVAALTTNTLAAVAVFTVFQLGAVALEGVGGISSASPVLAILASACAFLLAPLRSLLRMIADEFLFGVRPDPVVAANRVALGVGDDTHTALDTLREALILPFAELRVHGLHPITSGTRTEHLHTEILIADGRPVGHLVIGLRPGDLKLPNADAALISLAAPLLAQTLRAQALTASLQQSRSATAAAREEERLRLRRDLHDGLGPRLTGIAFTADAAQLSAEDRDLLGVHLARVRSEAVAAIREIREIVHELRPPALDEVGLVEAVRLQSLSLTGTAGRRMAVEICGDQLPELPAAVEVAAYRIATEALTNSARHSGANRAWVTFRADDDRLQIEVGDTGADARPWKPGIGIRSMLERAQELGGSLTFGSHVVQAAIPICPSSARTSDLPSSAP
jgi:two-component system NarL family sensor kinase